MNPSFGKLAIVSGIVIHFTLVSVWSLSGYRLHTLAARQDQSPFLQLLSTYIALTGSDQYWDFFAAPAYDEQLSLIVCDAIRFPGDGEAVECVGDILYQSAQIGAPLRFLGFIDPDSRAYRFSEQLIGLNQDQAYQQFLQFWINQAKQDKSSLYLIARYQTVTDPNEPPNNKLLWALTYDHSQ